MYLYGASGHAKVIIDILRANNEPIEALFDDNEKIHTLFDSRITFVGSLWSVDNQYRE